MNTIEHETNVDTIDIEMSTNYTGDIAVYRVVLTLLEVAP